MRYVCYNCGKLFTEDKIVHAPDDEYLCEPCYIDCKDRWLPDEDEPEDEPEQEELKPATHELTGAVDIKKSIWRRR